MSACTFSVVWIGLFQLAIAFALAVRIWYDHRETKRLAIEI